VGPDAWTADEELGHTVQVALVRSIVCALTLLGCSQAGGSAFTVTHATIEAGWSPVGL